MRSVTRRTSVRRAAAVWVFGAIAMAGTARVVALPETCGGLDESTRVESANLAATWLVSNQLTDGRFLYRYDVVNDRVIDDYNWVRHAGTMFSLAQAANAGIAIGEAFDSALTAVSTRFATSVDGARVGVRDGYSVSSGGTALLLIALLERREGGHPVDDVLIGRLVAYLRSALVDHSSDGSLLVRERADDLLNFGSDEPGPFTSGQTAFALAKFVNSGMSGSDDPVIREQVHRILRYLIAHKAVDEGFVPDMPEHWGAYTMGQMIEWSTGPGFTHDELAWARKQMGIASAMVRYESQRTNHGFDRWLRGRTSLGSAVGTHGEMLSGWLRVADRVPELRSSTAGLADRLRCNLSLLSKRQISAAEAGSFAVPGRAVGAWTWFGITQVDDQQHSLSALIEGGDVLASGIVERQQALPSSWLLVVLVVIAMGNAPRMARAVRREHSERYIEGSVRRGSRPALRGRARLLLPYVAAMVLGPTILRWLDTSVATAVVASGVVAVLAAIMSLVSRRADVALAFAAVRPELLIVAATCAAGGRWWAVVIGLLVTFAAAGRLAKKGGEATLLWGVRANSLVAVAAGVLLVVSGVYAV